jgi:hypothetical protein
MATQVLSATPTTLPNADAALAGHGAFARDWLEGMWHGDPLADAIVTDGALLMRRALAEGIDAIKDPPIPLAELFAEADVPPAWLDRDRCDRAALHLVRHAREYGLVLGAASPVVAAAPCRPGGGRPGWCRACSALSSARQPPTSSASPTPAGGTCPA